MLFLTTEDVEARFSKQLVILTVHICSTCPVNAHTGNMSVACVCDACLYDS